MGKGGHGGGAVGGSHSHNEEYPDDNWNLYQHVDRAEALNAEGDAKSVLRPFVRRLETDGSLVSDGDEELLVKITFRAPVSLSLAPPPTRSLPLTGYAKWRSSPSRRALTP